jgi:serine/threonine protein kinase
LLGDVLRGMLAFDQADRFSVDDALAHPYFSDCEAMAELSRFRRPDPEPPDRVPIVQTIPAEVFGLADPMDFIPAAV